MANRITIHRPRNFRDYSGEVAEGTCWAVIPSFVLPERDRETLK